MADRNRTRRVAAALAVAAIVAGASTRSLRAQNTWRVDTAVDLSGSIEQCVPGQKCPLRSALLHAREEGGGTIVVAPCAAPDDTGCLSTDDRAYDAASGRWIYKIVANLGAVNVEADNVTLDFRPLAADWHDPGDNRFVFVGPSETIGSGFVTEGSNGLLAGFTVTGTFAVSAVEAHVRAADNHLVGLAVADVDAEEGFRFRDEHTTGNVLENSWCGLSSDGRTPAPISGECIRLDHGANSNRVGTAEGPPVLVVAAGDAGVHVSDSGTNKNVLTSIRFGLDNEGHPAGGTAAGVVVDNDAGETEIVGNVIGGAKGAGIHVAGISYSDVIRENVVGAVAPDGPPHPNGGWGIELLGSTKSALVESNTVAHNGTGGIQVRGGATTGNKITRNSVFQNEGPEIEVGGGANNKIAPPDATGVTENRITGGACAGCIVEVFSGGPDGARYYEGEVPASVLGFFIYDVPDGTTFQGDYVSATQSLNDNTSGLSRILPIPGRAPSATPAPSVTPGGTPVPVTGTPGFEISAWIFLPRLLNR